MCQTMTSYTKKAIENSFLKLLNEYPLSRITVKMIVEDCHINRNSFYYHFQDIPSLLEEVTIEYANQVLDAIPNDRTLGESIETVLTFVVSNKKALLHIWKSIKREIFEENLMRVCEYIINRYMTSLFSEIPLDQEELWLINNFLKCEIFGQITDWLNQNMSFDIVEHIRKLCHFFEGTFRIAIENHIKTKNTSLIASDFQL